MSVYLAETIWDRGSADFAGGRYSRAHRLRFDGGIEVPGSSSPQVVPLPYSTPAAVDPEEAFVAALSACHMLWFLDFACRAGYCVDQYQDQAVGVMGKNPEGRLAFTSVTLHPKTVFSGAGRPNEEALRSLHGAAHRECFIANSVRCEVTIEPEFC